MNLFGGGRSDMDSRRDDLSNYSGSEAMSDHRNCINVGKGLRFKDTISELYDENEKQAVFNSSVKRGGAMHEFNQTLKNASPEQIKKAFKGVDNDYKPHPMPKFATSFTKKVPTDFELKATYQEKKEK